MTETPPAAAAATEPPPAPDAAPRDPANVVDVPSAWQAAVDAFNAAAGELGDKPTAARVRDVVNAGQAAIEAGQAYLDELATSTVEAEKTPDPAADPAAAENGGDVAEPSPAAAGDVAAPDAEQDEPITDAHGVKFAL